MCSHAEQDRLADLFARARLARPDPRFLDALEARLQLVTTVRSAGGRSASGMRWSRFFPAVLAAAAALLVAVFLPSLLGPADPRNEPGVPSANSRVEPGVPAVRSQSPMHALPVRDAAPGHAREARRSLMEMIRECDVILAGRFAGDGPDARFDLDQVLAGDPTGISDRLLTENGLVCPRSASPRNGRYAVVFGERVGEEIAVPSSSWLVSFEDREDYGRFVNRVLAYRGPDAADTIAELVRRVWGASKESGEADPAEREIREMLLDLVRAHAADGPLAIRDAVERAAVDLPPEGRVALRRLLVSRENTGGTGPLTRPRDLVEDLVLVGGLPALTSLLELQWEFAAKDPHALLLNGIARLDPAPAGAAGSSSIAELRKQIEAGRGVFPEDVLRRLEEHLARLEARGGVPAARASEELPALRREELEARLTRLNAALGLPPEADPGAGKDELVAAAGRIRAHLARRVALDPGGSLDARSAALEIVTLRAPDAIPADDVAALAADATLPYLLRLQAVELSGARRLPEAVEPLLGVLHEVRPEEYGPEPNRPWRRSRVTGRALRTAAITALGKIRTPAARSALEAALADPGIFDEAEARLAQATLDRMRDERRR